MQTSFTAQQNFNGAFRIKPHEIKAKNEIPTLFTQGRQIFHNILEQGDEVIVVRDNYDKRIANYLQEHKINGVEFFPGINTKSRLDDEKPQDLIKLLKDKTTQIITDINEMLSTIATRPREPKAPKPPKARKEIGKISNSLRLNIDNPQITSSAEVTLIRDDEKLRTIEIIMANKGQSYVYVKPDSLSKDSIRCIIDGQGQVIKTFETPDEIIKFSKQFRKMKVQKVNLLR